MTRHPTLLPQDLVVLLRIRQCADGWTYAEIGADLGMSASQVYASVGRSKAAGLVVEGGLVPGKPLVTQPNIARLVAFATDAAPLVFFAVRGPRAMGWPTAAGHPSFDRLLSAAAGAGALVPVWPDPEGPVLGEALTPIHRCALHIARAAASEVDGGGSMTRLYEQLAWVDVMRTGRRREQSVARQLLKQSIVGDAVGSGLSAVDSEAC